MTDIHELLKGTAHGPVRSTRADVAKQRSRRRRPCRTRAVTAAVAVVVVGGVAACTSADNSSSEPESKITADLAVDDADDPLPGTQTQRVARGPLSDAHVERVDLVFPPCSDQPEPLTDERRAELVALYLDLLDRWERDRPDPEFVNGTALREGPVRIVLSRRHGPTVDWFAQRFDLADLCIDPITPRGFYTAPPDLLPWEVRPPTPLDPSAEEVELWGFLPCGQEVFGARWKEYDDRVEVSVLYRQWLGAVNDCPGAHIFTVDLEEPLGDRPLVDAPAPDTLSAEQNSAVAGDTITFHVDPVLRSTNDTIGDDVMLQSLDDSSRQVQITGLFTEQPETGLPEPIEQDRWQTPTQISIPIPAALPAGEYAITFIDDPAFNGRITVRGNSVCPPATAGHRLSGGTLVAEQPPGSDRPSDQIDASDRARTTACWYVGAQLAEPFGAGGRITNAVTYYLNDEYTAGETVDDLLPLG